VTHNVISLPSIDALRKISLDHLLGGGQKAREEGLGRPESGLQSCSG
jgi:hypothetical protein